MAIGPDSIKNFFADNFSPSFWRWFLFFAVLLVAVIVLVFAGRWLYFYWQGGGQVPPSDTVNKKPLTLEELRQQAEKLESLRQQLNFSSLSVDDIKEQEQGLNKQADVLDLKPPSQDDLKDQATELEKLKNQLSQ